MTFVRLVFLIVIISSFFISCTAPSSREPSGEERTRVPDQILEGFTMNITDEGVKVSRFSAWKANIFNAEEMVESEDVKVEFYRSNGEHYSTLWADRGTLNIQTKDMDAYSNVIVESVDDIRLETESLHWDQEANLITTDDPVTLIQGEKKIEGVGLVSDPSLSDVKINKPTGVFRDIDTPGEE
jgi:LPS export ABC transporter protein LptC